MALEAISAACGSTGAVYTFHLLVVHLLVGGGPESLRQKYLPDMAKQKLGAMAFNEGILHFGDELETTTRSQDDHLVLNADKPFVTTAGEADIYIFSAQQMDTGERSVYPLLSQQYLLVDKETPGVFAPEFYDTMGLRGASNGRMKAENARVPKENIVSGPQYSLMKTDAFKIPVVVSPQVVSMGLAGAAFDAALQHTRKTGQAQWKTHLLGEMASRLDALRSYHYVGARKVEDLEYRQGAQISMGLKRLGGEEAFWICNRAIDIIGGASVFLTNPVQRAYRDARVASFLMLPIHDRRERLGTELFKLTTLAENDEPRTMAWEPLAEFTYLRTYSFILTSLPEAARRAFARSAIEQYVQSRGEDRVTADAFAEYLKEAERRMSGAVPAGAGGGPPGGGPPSGFPGGFPPGGPPGGFPPGGFPSGGPPGGFPAGAFPGGGPPGGFPPGGFPPGGFPPGGPPSSEPGGRPEAAEEPETTE